MLKNDYQIRYEHASGVMICRSFKWTGIATTDGIEYQFEKQSCDVFFNGLQNLL
jgi:hypothetical protein